MVTAISSCRTYRDTEMRHLLGDDLRRLKERAVQSEDDVRDDEASDPRQFSLPSGCCDILARPVRTQARQTVERSCDSPAASTVESSPSSLSQSPSSSSTARAYSVSTTAATSSRYCATSILVAL